jgi:DNA-binding beta-propeller fold protein YncE
MSSLVRSGRRRVCATALTAAAVAALLASACSSEPVVPVATVPGLGGTLIVPNKTRSTVTIVDVATGKQLASFPVSPEPHEIALSADGTTAVTTAIGGSTLSVIDVAGRRVVRTIDVGADSSTHGIAFLSGDSIVAVTSAATDKVALVDVTRGVVLGSIATAGGQPHILQATADGTRFYTSEAATGTISEFDAAQRRLTRTFQVPDAPEGMTVTPNGDEVWVGSSTFFSGRVSVLDPRSGAVTHVVSMFGWPYRIHLTPDARTVLVPDIRRGTLRLIDRASRRQLGIVRFGGGDPGGVAITPDGRYAFQTLNSQGRVAIVDVAARKVVGSLDVGDTPDGIAYTPRVFGATP